MAKLIQTCLIRNDFGSNLYGLNIYNVKYG